MARAEPAPAAPPVPLPGTRAGDLALAAFALLLVAQENATALTIAGSVAGLDPLLRGPAAWVVGGALALAMAAVVLWRRFHPRRVLVAVAVLAALSVLLVGGFASLLWPIAAFAVARAPQRRAAAAIGWIAVTYLLAAAVAATPRAVGAEAVGTRVGALVGMSLTVVPLLVVATVAGRWSRAAALRADAERAETDRLRRAAALDSERARIAEEIGGGVLAGLRELVGRAGALPAAGAAVTESELRAVRDRARSVLAAMRRVLGVLRSPTGDEHRPPPDPPVRRVPRRAGRVPLPDRAGLAALAAFVVPALALGVLVAPLRGEATGQPVVDGYLGLLQLPVGSAAAAAVVAVQFATVAWWRTAPVPALLVSGLGSCAASLLGGSNMFAEGGWTLLVWGAATHSPVAVSAVAALLSTGAVVTGGLFSGIWVRLGYPPGVAVVSFLAMLPLWAAGVAVRRHRLDTDRRRRDLADAGDRDALARERLRVARELHDVVAHHVSAIAVQAGAARLATDPAARAEALGHIGDSAERVAGALPELASLTPDPRGTDLSPAGVDGLVAPSRTAGLPLAVRVTGTPAASPGEAELFARRIVTEALTNTLRHAGPTPTRVHVEHRPDAVAVEVADDGPVPGHRADPAGSGLGLVGMRERVALLGGDLHTGGDGGGWTVRAVLPRTPLVREDDPAAPAISSCAPIRTPPPGT
ncbi:sensor histidine kinase [Pseudonocardia spirodelae]|uniref:histidine kinase n=1 Tax=Pseudonocardia spirodelae TaxID=3133431 RepID=A0ABU8T190_9PSEU